MHSCIKEASLHFFLYFICC